VAAVGAQGLGDLDAQLARRRQHERLDILVGRVGELEHGQAEGRRLARAGLSLADDVAALEQQRDRLLLDRAGRLVAHIAERGEDRLGQPEFGERRH
jgi:hypothetical protein